MSIAQSPPPSSPAQQPQGRALDGKSAGTHVCSLAGPCDMACHSRAALLSELYLPAPTTLDIKLADSAARDSMLVNAQEGSLVALLAQVQHSTSVLWLFLILGRSTCFRASKGFVPACILVSKLKLVADAMFLISFTRSLSL